MIAFPQSLTPEQQELVRTHADLPRLVATKLSYRLPRHLDLDDLTSAGLVGLVRAAQKYRPELNVSFSYYASRRVWGAILDDLRKNSPMNRTAMEAVKRGDESRRIHLDSLEKDMEDHGDRHVCQIEQPSDTVTRNDAVTIMWRLVLGLPKQKRHVIEQLLAGEDGAKIARNMGVTRRRVDQIRRESITFFRERMLI